MLAADFDRFHVAITMLIVKYARCIVRDRGNYTPLETGAFICLLLLLRLNNPQPLLSVFTFLRINSTNVSLASLSVCV